MSRKILYIFFYEKEFGALIEMLRHQAENDRYIFRDLVCRICYYVMLWMPKAWITSEINIAKLKSIFGY